MISPSDEYSPRPPFIVMIFAPRSNGESHSQLHTSQSLRGRDDGREGEGGGEEDWGDRGVAEEASPAIHRSHQTPSHPLHSRRHHRHAFLQNMAGEDCHYFTLLSALFVAFSLPSSIFVD